MTTTFRAAITLAAFLGLGALLSLGCEGTKQPDASSPHHPKNAASTDPGDVVSPEYSVQETKTLFQDNSSAYSARMFRRNDETVIVTPTSLFRIGQNEQVARYKANIGHLSARLEDSIVFWRDGQLRALSLDKMKESEVLQLKLRPQVLLSEGPRLAWLSQDETGIYSIQTASAGEVNYLYASKQGLSVPTLYDETVYFVENTSRGWRLGRVPLDGSRASFGKERSTRTPSMLAGGPDGIYFYDGLKRGVRKARFDLLAEEAVNEDVICSPLAVSDRVVCAQVGGIIDIPRPGAPPRIVAAESGGPIADMTASDTMAYWIADSGDNRMTVRSAPLPSL